jgi:hypothetical protein
MCLRMLSPSIEAIAPVSRSTISCLWAAVNTPSMTVTWISAIPSSLFDDLPWRRSSTPRTSGTSGRPLTLTPNIVRAATIARRMEPSATAGPAVLLERDHEVERVDAVLRAVGRRSGGVLVIEGAAGLGKSRLLEEARAAAPDLGVRVLAALASDLEQGYPFGVMPQLSSDRCWRPRAASATAGCRRCCACRRRGHRLTNVVVGRADGSIDQRRELRVVSRLYWLASNLTADSPLVVVGRRPAVV